MIIGYTFQSHIDLWLFYLFIIFAKVKSKAPVVAESFIGGIGVSILLSQPHFYWKKIYSLARSISS